jgi:hypothetical protein
VAAAVAIAMAAPAGASAPPPRSALQGFACHRSADSLNRWIEVTAVMRPVSGTQRMEMKFQLLRRGPHSRKFTDVSGSGTDLGKWLHPKNRTPPLGSRPGDHWSVRKPVVNLSAPAAYRFRVSFRWLGAHGSALHTVAQLSRVCDQR